MTIGTLQTSLLFNSLPMIAAGEIPLANITPISRAPSTGAEISRLSWLKPSAANMAPIARRASAFVSPKEVENKRLAHEVEQILRNKSMAVTEEGEPMSRILWHDTNAVGFYADGQIHLPRLEALHRLLCGKKGPENSTALEFTQAPIPLTSAVLTSMGTQVTYANTTIGNHRRISKKQLPETWRRLIKYHHSHLRSTDEPSYDVTYWADPPYSDIVYRGLLSTSRMGAMVVEG